MSEIINAVVPIDAITPHPRNYKKHPESQIYKLKKSHERFKQYRSVVIWQRPEGGYVQVAGHGIVKAMKERGVTQVRADILPEDTSQEDIDGILAADNLLPEESEDDEELLATLLQEQQDAGFDLAALGTDDETLRQMLEALGDAYLGEDEDGAGGDEFDTTPDEEQTRVKLGDIWQLGRHKIACIDSTDVDQIKRLFDGKVPDMVWADPPYGINLLEKRGTVGLSRVYNPVLNDDNTQVALVAYRLINELFPSTIVQIWWGANYYANTLPPSSCWIIWDKDHHGMTFADAELAWVNQDEPTRCFRHAWSGAHRDSERGEERIHPTQKPVALSLWCFEKYGRERDLIYDPFLGSGISVIAAQRIGSTVYGCELSPAYINKVIERYEAETGHTAQLLERIEEPSHA